jgi:hypothetical protein
LLIVFYQNFGQIYFARLFKIYIYKALFITTEGVVNFVSAEVTSSKLFLLQVIAAVLFGVSIALKDGVEKASEYFTGCVLRLLTDL